MDWWAGMLCIREYPFLMFCGGHKTPGDWKLNHNNRTVTISVCRPTSDRTCVQISPRPEARPWFSNYYYGQVLTDDFRGALPPESTFATCFSCEGTDAPFSPPHQMCLGRGAQVVAHPDAGMSKYYCHGQIPRSSWFGGSSKRSSDFLNSFFLVLRMDYPPGWRIYFLLTP